MASVDNFYITAGFFGLVIFFLAILVFWSAAYGLTNFWTASPVGTTIRDNADRAFGTFDYTLVIAYVALHLGILIVSFLLRSHPVVYVISIFLTAILTLIAAPLSNAYEIITADPNLSAVAADIPMANYIMYNLPYFEVVWAIITMIVLYGLSKYSEGA